MHTSQQKKYHPFIDYYPAELCEGKEWFIYYWVLHPETKELIRKRIKFNRIKSITERRKQAKRIVLNLNLRLARGWNPFINPETNKGYKKVSEAITYFLKLHVKNLEHGAIRRETFNGYNSYCGNLVKYMKSKEEYDMFVYKFDKAYINRFLDYIYVERERSPKTRDNYLAFLRVFSSFLLNYDYVKVKPTDGIQVLGKRKHGNKSRKVIPDNHLNLLFSTIEKSDKHFLLSCSVLYYCFVRPKEMSYLKVGDINIKNRTIFIDGETAKNHQNAVVTIRKPLLKLIEDLKIENYPKDYYLFSNACKPGESRRDEKQFRDKWIKYRKNLGLSDTYQFYSLKDTGITNLLTKIGDPRLVRDQARHHSIAMTDIYTSHDMMKGNKFIADLED